jgi:aspartyl-tRNA synthetase
MGPLVGSRGLTLRRHVCFNAFAAAIPRQVIYRNSRLYSQVVKDEAESSSKRASVLDLWQKCKPF